MTTPASVPSAVPSLALNSGGSIPQLGLGTWPLDDAEVEKAIVAAAELGYRHVDTAVKYGNEIGVGRGVAASGVAREDWFVTTKLDGEYQGQDRAVAGLDASLERLGLDYVDLLLIHWPLPSVSARQGRPARSASRTSSRRTSTRSSPPRASSPP
jgi:2,5-diketo-D-gluconate reductase A